MYLVIRQRFYVVFDVFRVGCDHRAVVVISCFRGFVALVRNARIENVGQSLADQPFDMTVREFCRVAFGFARDRFNTKFVDLSRRFWGQNGAVTQFPEEDRPERVVFIHIQDTWDADGTARRQIGGQRFIIEHTVVFIVK